MKRKTALCLPIVLLLTFAAFSPALAAEKHIDYIWNTFDTVIILTCYTDTEEEHQAILSLAEEEFQRLHRIFDQYYAYDGIANLYQLNQSAASAPFTPEAELYELLLLVDQWRASYSDKTNPAMGAVLKLWHTAREETLTPPRTEELQEASLHCRWEDVTLENGTVFFQDPLLSLDLGSVAKGYATQIVADKLRERGYTSFLINAGGNVAAGEAPADGRSAWSIGVENPDEPGSALLIVKVTNRAVITSGDYQRYFESDGIRYHHLIDPETLFPGTYFRSVSLICEDSALGDFLSTALFLTTIDEGFALAESIPGLEVMWILPDGTTRETDGFASYAAQ